MCAARRDVCFDATCDVACQPTKHDRINPLINQNQSQTDKTGESFTQKEASLVKQTQTTTGQFDLMQNKISQMTIKATFNFYMLMFLGL